MTPVRHPHLLWTHAAPSGLKEQAVSGSSLGAIRARRAWQGYQHEQPTSTDASRIVRIGLNYPVGSLGGGWDKHPGGRHSPRIWSQNFWSFVGVWSTWMYLV